ncbi:carbohydrate binding domain-containing protein [Micromonospora sp. S-DT3-3-22]|uniref:carbohydrate binding domain-containing protein n=1 Tax=Micromonospora sp. S-DT3-3-22 TaxID=2755359 RepID=UPI00188DCAB0|nr:carbohydrate binding domain-containing protein [Micromonospora sp. S-DT3-3-22]
MATATTYDLQFVEGVAAVPVVRLDVNAPGWTIREADFGMPQLNRALVSTLLGDGDRYPAAAYGNRTLTLTLRYDGASADDAAAQIQRLYRELDRLTNVLLYRPGTSSAVFFRTFRCGPDSVQWVPFTRQVRAAIPAEPFAVGPRETLPQVVVANDPTATTPLNTNPWFETDVAGWTGTGGTIGWSTAQSYEGAASLLLTPGGVAAQVDVRSDLIPVTAGQQYKVATRIRSTVTRSVSTNINWYDGSGTYLSTSTTTASFTAGNWTYAELTATAPVGASQARAFPAVLGSTPPAGNTVHVDEARFYRVATSIESGGLCFDVSGIRGDVETPLYLRIVGEDVTTVPSKWTFGLGRRQSLISVRRRGTPSAAPGVYAAESLNRGDDTTLVTGVAGAHGGAVVRTSFATSPGMVIRFGPAAWPTAASPDLRGTYRQLVRCRKSVAGDVIQMRAVWSQDSTVIYGDIVTLPADNVWRWIDLGLIQIPMGFDPVTDGLSGVPAAATGPVFDTAIERISGSGNIDSDSVAFVPADDRMMGVVFPTSGLPTAFVIDSAASGVYGVGSSAEVRSARVETAGLPPMVSPGVTNRIWWMRDVGSEFATGDDATAYTRITPYYWPRYLHVRPVTT